MDHEEKMTHPAPVPALTGWRREFFGEEALIVKCGRLALGMDGGKVVPVPHMAGTEDKGKKAGAEALER